MFTKKLRGPLIFSKAVGGPLATPESDSFLKGALVLHFQLMIYCNGNKAYNIRYFMNEAKASKLQVVHYYVNFF